MKKILISLSFALLSLTLIAQVSQTEKQALLDFYLATNGENWVNTWDIKEPVSNWHGITVENNQVTGISLLFNNIEGTLPASIGDLNNLKILELSFNKLSGTIPVEIGQLTSLELLIINGNDLNGSIPATIGDLETLRELHLSSNRLSGFIPGTIGNLSNLEILNLFDNNLSGTLPIGLSNLTKLKKLIIAENGIIETKVFSSILLFKDDSDLNINNKTITPLTKTIIASETSDDEN
jgi:Leucine-rich repeat (LRR) protein